MGYSSRSKAVHDAFRSLITEYEWMHKEEGEITGAIVLLFYIDKPRLLNKIAKTQQKYKNVIVSTMNISVTIDKILEIIAVKGDAKQIKNLIQELTTEKGIKQLKFSAIAV